MPHNIEAFIKFPLPGFNIPISPQFAPNGKQITYLHSTDSSIVRQLYLFDPDTGETKLLVKPIDDGTTEENLSLEEKLIRERQRQRALGITSYNWHNKNGRLLIPLPTGIYIGERTSHNTPFTLKQLVDATNGPLLDPQFSPDGHWVAYVQNDELYIIATSGGTPRQLTHNAREKGVSHGLAEYIAQEEMGRRHGYWWSPDSQSIAFTEVDERHIPVYRIMHQGQDHVGEGAQEDHRYPFAGKANAKIRLGITTLSSHDTPIWMDLGPEEDIYLARVKWLPNGRLSAQIQNRNQTELWLKQFDPSSGESQPLLHEQNQTWINLHHIFRPLHQSSGFIWASEQTGFRHLYLHDEQGQKIRPLSRGNWQVDTVEAIDETNQCIYFSGTLDTPLEKHLYVIPFAGGEPRRLTQLAGVHNVVIHLKNQQFIDTHHALDRQPSITLHNLSDGTLITTIYNEQDPRVDELKLAAPEQRSFQNRHGDTLYGTLYRPPATFGSGPFPTIIYVYGGPHVQLVTNSWLPRVMMRAQYLRQLGFLVFTVDNRGSNRRGLTFEGAIKHDMGHAEVEDQVDGVRWLVAQGLADANRVGIYGGSYGGYMSAMCLARAPETFHVAVATAPVTHWDGYDTHYTERYMGTPETNPEGYAVSSIMHHIHKIVGKLLLVHGLIDENVHFRHTARLINALIRARKPYDLLLFPNERHSPRGHADRIYMEERIVAYFIEHLKNKQEA